MFNSINTSGNASEPCYTYGGHKVAITDIRAVGVNGPETSRLTIDEMQICGQFSPDLIFYEDYIIAAKFQGGAGFRLAIIHFTTKQIHLFGSSEAVLLPKEVKNKRVYYYIDGAYAAVESILLPI